jgi:hypothetical protein
MFASFLKKSLRKLKEAQQIIFERMAGYTK